MSSSKIYMFHDIIENGDCSTKLYTVNSSNLEMFFLGLLNDNKSAKNLYEICKVTNINKKFFSVTFDDAYESIYKLAYPILKKYQIPFTIFMSTSFINIPGYLTVDQLKELALDDLCIIGSHGVNHIYFRQLSDNMVLEQFNVSKNILEEITGKEVVAFAFPFGSFVSCSLKNIKLLSKTDYEIGFSTIPSGLIWPLFKVRNFLPRINVTENFIIKSKYI
ncbi:MAG: polysaccharide deacetylase family protein [Mariniphaga sp.]